jgi:hypothetical protein
VGRPHRDRRIKGRPLTKSLRAYGAPASVSKFGRTTLINPRKEQYRRIATYTKLGKLPAESNRSHDLTIAYGSAVTPPTLSVLAAKALNGWADTRIT